MAAFVHPFVPILGPELQHSNLNNYSKKSVSNKNTKKNYKVSKKIKEENLSFESSTDQSKKKIGFTLFSKVIATLQRNKNTMKNSNIKYNYSITTDDAQLFGECSSSKVYDIESNSEHKVSHFVFLYTVKDCRIRPVYSRI